MCRMHLAFQQKGEVALFDCHQFKVVVVLTHETGHLATNMLGPGDTPREATLVHILVNIMGVVRLGTTSKGNTLVVSSAGHMLTVQRNPPVRAVM